MRKTLCLLAVVMWFVPLTGMARAADHVVIAQSNESLIWAPLYIARKLGYFQDEGIDIDVVVVKSGPAALTAVNAGSAQMALGFPATPIEAVGKGFKLKIIAELSNQFIAELMLRKDVADKLRVSDRSPITQRIKALRGLTIATNGTGSANDYLLERIIRDAGLKPDVDVTITPIGGGPTILAAFDQHRIDGFVATPTDQCRCRARPRRNAIDRLRRGTVQTDCRHYLHWLGRAGLMAQSKPASRRASSEGA